MAVRRSIVGGPTVDDASLGAETPELRALRDAERELFPQAAPATGTPWPTDLPFLIPPEGGAGRPLVQASGLPPSAPTPSPSSDEADASWLGHLEMPDIPVRWDERVIRYVEFLRDDPRGHLTFAKLYRRSGRWRDMMRRSLRRKSLPEDLIWVSMVESGFESIARSAVGAAGLWQFMPETAKIYGLTVDRWLDQRLAPNLETDAAADFLADLHRRFGSWELALAAYDMGYAGLASVVRRYNTNDFFSLARTEGTLPWETTLYVPKIMAVAVVVHNLATFGFTELQLDPSVDTDDVDVLPGTPLSLVAQAAGCTQHEIEQLNPELRASRTPPASVDPSGNDAPHPPTYAVRVPQGKGATAAQGLSRLRRDLPPLDRYVVRFGETMAQVAEAHKTTTQKLVELNAIAPGEAVRGGTVLLVPHGSGASVAPSAAGSAATTGPAGPAGATGAPALAPPRQSVVVPSDVFVYPDRRRVFYRVLVADTLGEIAGALHVSPDDLCRWNDLDASARLQEGMSLQAFVRTDVDLSRVVVLTESEVRVLPIGSDEFYSALEHDKGVRRISVVAAQGDTLEGIGRRYGVSARTMERINRRGRGDALKAGDVVVVYAPTGEPGGMRATGPIEASVSGVPGTSLPSATGVPGSPPRPADLLP